MQPYAKRTSQPSGSVSANPGLKVGTQSRSFSLGTSSPSTPVPSAQWQSQRPADPAKSLYNQCSTLLHSIDRIPTVHPYIVACSYSDDGPEGMPKINLGVAPFGHKMDPVSQLWRVLRLGAPLCAIFNVFDPNNQIEVLPAEECTDTKTVKRLLYRFLQACLGPNLKPQLENSLFTISNVFSDSTGDLLKVLKTVQIILDLLIQREVLPPLVPVKDLELPASSSQRDNVVNELVQTERKYVQDLELMGQYQEAMLAANISRETVQRIFPYLSSLVDFQRRFLVGLEYHARLPPMEQHFGSLFELMRDEFQVYEGYTLNQREAAEVAQAEVPTLRQFSDILEPNYELPQMLLKPVQRIAKYPLLLKQLVKYTPSDWNTYPTLVSGLEIMQDIVQAVNETQRRIECRYVFSDLMERVKDWHDIDTERLGQLMLSGVFPVLERDSETEYHFYLCENILLCCKDNLPPKKGLKMRASRTNSTKRASLDLKGRLYLSSVLYTSVKKETSGYILSITWGRGDAQETGHFDVRLQNEEQANLWDSAINKLLAQRSADGVPIGYDEDDPSPFYEEKTPLSSPIDPLTFRKLSIGSSQTFASPSSHDNRHSGMSTGGTLTTRSGSAVHMNNLVSKPPLPHTYSDSTLGSSFQVHEHDSAPPVPHAPILKTGSNSVRVRINFLDDQFTLIVDKNIAYTEFLSKVERKIRLCGKLAPSPLRIKYCDEDDDFVTLSSDEDLLMAFDCSSETELNLLVS